jgi:hypothetical protein
VGSTCAVVMIAFRSRTYQTLLVPSSRLCFQETVYSFTDVGNQIGCDGADQGGVVLCRGEIPLDFLAAFFRRVRKISKSDC